MKAIASSELILNADNSIYHLKLHPEQLADDVIVVGDPGRVSLISAHFDRIDHIVTNREFVTHTGIYKGKKITALATGIGTDNIDIVINELDALVNIDLTTRTIKEEKKSLNIVRIGTCGALQKDVDVDTFAFSKYGLGLDGLMNYYKVDYNNIEEKMLTKFYDSTGYSTSFAQPYFIKSSDELAKKLSHNCSIGITATAPGFYAPQGRELRIPLREPQINEKLRDFSFENERIINFEMETAAIYGLSRALGHDACTLCAVVANRFAKTFSKDYKPTIHALITHVLDGLTLES